MSLSILQFHLTLSVGNHLYGVHALCHDKELTSQVEEVCRIIWLFEIEFLISLVILLSHRLIEYSPNLLVVLIGRVFQKLLHTGLGLWKVLSFLHLIHSSSYLFLLCRNRDTKEREANSYHQYQSFHPRFIRLQTSFIFGLTMKPLPILSVYCHELYFCPYW